MDILKVKEELETIQENSKQYYPLKVELINQAKALYGEDIFRNYAMPEDFNLETLDKNYFFQRQYQEVAMPYSNRLIAEMIEMPKYPVNSIERNSKNGKRIQGVYMVGKNKYDKPVLFAFSVVKDEDEKSGGFNIKLDVCPQGKLWLNLLRLDIGGNIDPHPNFFNSNKVHKDVYDVDYTPVPHLHRLNEESQVLCHHNLEYTSAIGVDNILEQIVGDYNNDIVVASVNYFLKYCNVKLPFNKEITKMSDFNNTYVFSYESLYYGNNARNIKQFETKENNL